MTSTSFQDTPGAHHDLLDSQNFEVDTLRGPLKEKDLLPIIHQYDGIICSDDEYTRSVLEKGKSGKLKVISKYGVGLDKIDLGSAKELGIEITNCLGVNHITVAEHVFSLLLCFEKNVHLEYNYTQKGEWVRLIGNEIFGRKIAIIGLGRIGKEVARRAVAFGMDVKAYDIKPNRSFCSDLGIEVADTIADCVEKRDIITLHLPLDDQTYHVMSDELMHNHVPKGTLLINTSRADLVDMDVLVSALENGILRGYLTDVLEEEPMKKDHPLLQFDNVIITPHIGSRTYQSVERQGMMAVDNLIKILN